MYRGDLTEAIKDGCNLCQIHYLRYNLLIFEVDPSRVVGLVNQICCGISCFQMRFSHHTTGTCLNVPYHRSTLHLNFELLLFACRP